jgi:hypothetical protein
MPESIREEIRRLAARISTERWPDAEGEERLKLNEAHGLLERADYAMKRADNLTAKREGR